MRKAVAVEVGDAGIEALHAVAVELQPQHPADGLVRVVDVFHHEIADAVDDRLALVVLDVLRDMRMAADDGVGAGIDHPSRQLALAQAGDGFRFPSPSA